VTTRRECSLHSRTGVAIALTATALLLLPACGSSAKSDGSAPTPSTTANRGDQPSTSVRNPPGSATGKPSHKPCDLLTRPIAEDALGVAVGEPVKTPGEGNETCTYKGTDKTKTAMVYLTTYAAKGSVAVLDQAAAQFANAHAVDGVGDAARVSVDDHAIGVLEGDVVFGIGLIPPSSGQGITPVTESQLVDLANAVRAAL
jgi:hypothetical protein